MGTAYSQLELDAMRALLRERRPKRWTFDEARFAPEAMAFAILADRAGAAINFEIWPKEYHGKKSVRCLTVNPEVARYLIGVIAAVGERAAWSIYGMPLHPRAPAKSDLDIDFDEERAWKRALAKPPPVPDQSARDNSPRAIAVGGFSWRKRFVAHFVLEDEPFPNIPDTICVGLLGALVAQPPRSYIGPPSLRDLLGATMDRQQRIQEGVGHIRMNPIVAWELAKTLYKLGTAKTWWNEKFELLPA
jgi:hypothetical protein